MNFLPPKPVFALFSGGKDSFATASVLNEVGLLKGVILLDTGISADTWLEQTIAMAIEQKWSWQVIPTSVRYEWFVWRYGFPGPGMHGAIMNYLKGRAIREFRKNNNIDALASGVRLAESGRRSLNAAPISLFERVTIYAPILDWTTENVWKYVRAKGYRTPSTYLTLGTSGDCLCGAFAGDHEREAIANHYPKANRIIERCEQQCGQKWGQRSVDASIKVPREMVSEELQGVLCFDCARPVTPRFHETFCSQCGGSFGPGEDGYSHCSDHKRDNVLAMLKRMEGT